MIWSGFASWVCTPMLEAAVVADPEEGFLADVGAGFAGGKVGASSSMKAGGTKGLVALAGASSGGAKKPEAEAGGRSMTGGCRFSASGSRGRGPEAAAAAA